MFHSTYRGVNIYRNTEPHKLKWYIIAPMESADTLAGIKQLIQRRVDS